MQISPAQSKRERPEDGVRQGSAAYLSQWVVAPRDLRVGVDVLQVPREGFALQGFPQRFPGRHIAVIHLHNTWNRFIKRNRGSKSGCHKGRHHQLANSLPPGPSCWHCYTTAIYQHWATPSAKWNPWYKCLFFFSDDLPVQIGGATEFLHYFIPSNIHLKIEYQSPIAQNPRISDWITMNPSSLFKKGDVAVSYRDTGRKKTTSITLHWMGNGP